MASREKKHGNNEIQKFEYLENYLRDIIWLKN